MVKDEPQAETAPAAVQPSEGTGGNPGGSPDKPARKRRLDVNPSLILNSEGRSKRRRTPSVEPADKKPDMDPKDPERAKQLGLQLFNKIMAMTDSSGESMAQPFVKLPNKRQFPDYYDTIKHPMSLDMVHDKLEAAQYDTLNSVCHDFGQIWNNAKRYNIRDSVLFQWAKKLHKVTRTFYFQHTSQNDDSDSEAEDDEGSRGQTADPDGADEQSNATPGPSTPAGDHGSSSRGGAGTGKKRGAYMKDGPTVYKLIKPCMRAIKEAKSEDGRDRDIAAIFIHLPDRREFQDYYRTVKHPVSLDQIEQRMVARRYDGAEQFFDDVELMCDNALSYNEDESEVWRDARQIRNIVSQHRDLVKERLSQVRTGSSSKQRVSAITPVRHSGQASTPHTTHTSMAFPPDVRSSYQQQTSFPTTPAGASASYHASPAISQSPAPVIGSSPYLPQLPHGVVTEEVVASLDRYPAYEQQLWAASLPALAQNIYRQMVAANEARKRGVAPPQPSPMELTPHGSRVGLQAEPRPPGSPTIKRIDLAYTMASRAPPSPVVATTIPVPPPSATSTLPAAPAPRNAIRLHNLRGVVTHSVLVGAGTAELELTAWLLPPAKGDPAPVADNASSTPGEPNAVAGPEVSLRVNGTPAPVPVFLYGAGTSAVAKDRPAGMRWTVPARGMEMKIEVVASKPGVKAETTGIYVNRQF